MNSKLVLSLNRRQPKAAHQTTVIKGGGNKDFTFPTNLVQSVVKKLSRKKLTPRTPPAEAAKQSLFGTSTIWQAIKPKTVAAQLPDDVDFLALVRGSDCIQGKMIGRQFDEAIGRVLGDMESVAALAQKQMDARYQPAITDHIRQVTRLREKLHEVLPEIIKELAEKNPDVPFYALLQHAIEGIVQQLGGFISVLSAYTNAFSQNMDGRFARKLKLLNRYMQECFGLYMTGNLEAVVTGTPTTGQMPGSSFQVGDVLLTCFGGDGLGTIPGSEGPIGVHLLMVPWDMQDWIPQALPLLAHESRHQIFHDVKGLAAELQKVVAEALLADHKAGVFTLSAEKTRLGKQMVPTIDLLVKLFAGDCLGEIDADVAGILMSGSQFHTAMLLSFPAMLIQKGRVKDATKLLRTGTVYTITPDDKGNAQLEFEVHPPDVVRTAIGAAVYKEIGMPTDEELVNRLSGLCVGEAFTDVTWVDSKGKSKMVIKIPMVDIVAAIPTLVKALIRKPLVVQNGKATGDLVMWTLQREAKVARTAALLLAGKSDLPTDAGSMYSTYLGAAKAYSDACTAGEDPGSAMERINEATYTMSEQL